MRKNQVRQRLMDLLISRSFAFTEKPEFKLASGEKSNFYFNCKPTALNSEGMFLIGHLIYDLIRKNRAWKSVQAVGGLTLGADPLATATAYTAHLEKRSLEAFIVRKEPKRHGTMSWIEGNVKRGDSVLILEDVITSGGSSIKAVKRAQESGLRVMGVIALIDRQEGGREAVEATGLPFHAILTREEIFKVYCRRHKIRGRSITASP